jgi:hypothetical protein
MPGDSNQNPWLTATQAIVPGIVGLYGAQQQQNLGNRVAGTIPAAVQPATSLGAGTSNYLQTGVPMGGPMGQSQVQQTQAAAQLGNVANQYASGNLTPAQVLALQQGVNAATAGKNLAFSMSGNPLSSASIMEGQNINNQAIIASQQIQQNNIQLASNALQSVQSVYNNLVSQVLNAANLGGSAATAAAQLIMKNNADVQKNIQSIWQNITKSIIGAAAQTPEVTNFFKNLLGQNTSGGVNPSTFVAGGGGGGSDWSAGVSTGTPSGGNQLTTGGAPTQQFNWLGSAGQGTSISDMGGDGSLAGPVSSGDGSTG